MSDKRFLLFYRVDSKFHLENLQSGNVKFSPLTQYKKLEEVGKPHLDPEEGLISVSQPGTLRIDLLPGPGHEKVVEDIFKFVGPATMSVEINASIFCLSAIYQPDTLKGEEEHKYEVPKGMREFGDHMILITNLEEFHKRIISSAKQAGLKLKSGSVIYLDKAKFNDRVDPRQVGFTKLDKLAFQQEFRYLIQFDKIPLDKYFLKIGSIEDISIVAPVGDMSFIPSKKQGKVYYPELPSETSSI